MRQEFSLFKAILILVGFAGCSSPQDIPRAQKGLLDISNWSWEDHEKIALDGEWFFYWRSFIPPQSKGNLEDSFIQVPGTWDMPEGTPQVLPDTGYATYKLSVLLPPDSVPLSLRVSTAATAMHIWVNGKSVYQAGQVATSSSQARPGINPQVIDLPFSSTLDIIVHVSNYNYRKGGLWTGLMLGTSNAILDEWTQDHATTFFLIGSFIIMALYHLILYLHRRSDRSSLYFSIFCLLVVVRTLSTDLYIIAGLLPYSWTIKAEFLSFYLCIPVFIAFTQAIYPSAIPCSFAKVVVYTTAAFSAVVLLFPPLWFTYTVIPFEILAIIAGLYGFYKILITSKRYPLEGVSIFLLGFLCLFATLVNDSLYANYLVPTFFAAPFGLFLFLFFQSTLLSRRFSRLANDLECTNRVLEQRNQLVEEKNTELTKLNQEMDVFVYRTSHDLRAPLTSLLGIISLMRNESLSSEMISYLDLQERSIQKLDSFVREILDYSRNSRLALVPERIDFQSLIDETYALYTHLPQFEQINKQTTVNQESAFLGDTKRLEVVFNNLISNSLRYYNPYQSNPYIQIEVNVDESQASIQIKDNGLGIASEHLERIFDMFYRASTGSEGSGLGLFLVKETIEKMKGTIRVDSVVNQGTTFTVSLPNQVKAVAAVNQVV